MALNEQQAIQAYYLTDYALNKNYSKYEPQQIEVLNGLKEMALNALPINYHKTLAQSIRPEVLKEIEKNPEEYFKEAIDMYGSMDEYDEEQLKNINAVIVQSKAEIIKQGRSPEEAIEKKSLPGKFIEGLGSVLNTPLNFVLDVPSQVFTDKKINWAKGSGFVDLIKNIQQNDPEVARIVEKASYGDQLTEEEMAKYKDAQGNSAIFGTALNLLPLATGLAGGGLKLVGKAKNIPGLIKAGKTVQSAGNVASADLLSWLSEINIGGRLAKAALDPGKVLRENVNSIAKASIPLSGGKKQVIKLANEILSKATPPTAEDFKKIKQISTLFRQNNPKYAKLIDSGLNSMVEYTAQHAKDVKFAQNPLVKAYASVARKPKELTRALMDTKPGQRLSRLFGQGVIEPMQDLFQSIRRTTNRFKDLGGDARYVLRKGVNQYGKKWGVKVPEAIKQYHWAVEKPSRFLKDFILKEDDLKFAARVSKLGITQDALQSVKLDEIPALFKLNKVQADRFNDMAGVVNMVNEAKAELIFKELISSVDTPILEFGGKVLRSDSGTKIPNPVYKEMDTLIKKYRKLIREVPDHPRVDTLRGEIIGKISEAQNRRIGSGFLHLLGDPDNAEQLLYNTRLITKEYRDFMATRQGQKFEDLIYLPHGESMTTGIGASKKAIKAHHQSQVERMNKLKNKSIPEINALSREEEVVKGFKGDIFVEDPDEILRVRFNRGAYAIYKGMLKDGLEDLYKQQMGNKFTKGEKIFYTYQPSKAYVLTPYVKQVSGKSLWIHKSIADKIDDAMQMYNPKKLSAFTKLVDGVSGWLKGMMTVAAFQKFFLRNTVGNIFNIMLSSTSPEYVAKGFQYSLILMKKYLGQHMPSGMLKKSASLPILNMKEIANLMIPTENGGIYSLRTFMKEALEQNVMGSGFGREILSQLASGIDNPVLRKAVGAANLLNKVGGAANQYVEDVSKFALYIARRMQGDDKAQAAKIVFKYLFDYSDVTATERKIIKRLIPFYTWMRKNLPLQVKNMFSPTTAKTLLVQRSVNNMNPETFIDPRFKEGYMKDNQYIVYNKDPIKKTATMLSLSGLLPLYDIGALPSLIGERNIEWMMSQINPVWKNIAQVATKTDFRTRQPLERYPDLNREEGTAIPGAPVAFTQLARMFKQNLQPVNMLETVLDTEFLADRPIRSKGLDMAEKILYMIIGKPVKYDERYKKFLASRDTESKIMMAINNIRSDMKRLNKDYKGEYPKYYDGLLQNYMNVYKAYITARERGFIGRTSNIVSNNLKSLSKDIIMTSMKFRGHDVRL